MPDDTMRSEFYCDMGALTPEQRQRHGELAALLRPLVREFQELSDGYRAVFTQNLDAQIAEFCQLEQRCCPFFTLQLEDNEGASVLSVTGPGNIKPFIRAEFAIPEIEERKA